MEFRNFKNLSCFYLRFVVSLCIILENTCIALSQAKKEHSSKAMAIPFPEDISWQLRIMERYLEIQSISLIDCAKECMRRKRCQSFNYSQILKFCELCYTVENKGNKDPSKVAEKFVHSDINSWSKVAIRIIYLESYACLLMMYLN